MAFLVRFLDPATAEAGGTAAYLDRGFYKAIFARAANARAWPSVAGLAALGYGDELVVDAARIGAFADELERLSRLHRVPQADVLLAVARDARARGLGLVISGDMHPVLTRRDS